MDLDQDNRTTVLICIQTFDTLMVSLKYFFEKFNFEKKKAADDKKSHEILPRMQRVNTLIEVRLKTSRSIEAVANHLAYF